MPRAVPLLLIVVLAGCAPVQAVPVQPPPVSRPLVSRPPVASPQAARKPPEIRYPVRGGGRFRTAAAQTATPGSGSVLRYRVLVEKDITGLAPAAFAAEVQRTLEDPRGWSAGGERRLRRVGPGQRYDFTLYLVTPGTRDQLCHGSDGYTSCRSGDNVVLNVARWVKGVPRYGASLTVYRQYLVNHEVGHRLGQGHELCPGRGEPAPVMQQQTLGLHGCEPYAWPFRAGERYAGRSGAYQDDVPPPDRGN